MHLPLLLTTMLCGAHLLAQATTQVVVPEFSTGDVAKLRCKVAEIGGKTDYHCWLEVEVHNGGDDIAEPIAFHITLPGKKRSDPPLTEVFHRTSLPHVQRFGRPVAPGEKRSYWLCTQLVGNRTQYGIEVAQACFHDGTAVAKPDLVADKLEEVQLESMIGTFPVTRVPLQNPFAHDLDAVFLVTLTQPVDIVELYAVRIPAGARLDWDLYSRPSRSPYLEPDPAPATSMRAKQLELVDWVLVAPSDEAAGKQLFASAYANWLRWPDPTPSLRGRFVHTAKRQRINSENAYDEQTSSGTFTVRGDGTVDVELDGSDAEKSNPQNAIRAAFGDLLRRPIADVQSKNRSFLIDRDRVELHGPGFGIEKAQGARVAGSRESPGNGSYPWFVVDRGRFTGTGRGDLGWEHWQTRDFGAGYVVTRKASPDGNQVETFGYGEAAGLIVPTRWQATTTYGNRLFSDEALALSEFSIAGDAPIAADLPTGDGVDALRAIWDGAARVPSAPIELRADVEIRNPGSDLIWLNHQRIRGTVTMIGIGRHCQSLTLDCRDKFAPEVERSLASALFDRFVMWFGRDLNDRPAFDTFFRGARIDAEKGGEFRVTDGPVCAVHVRDGLIRRFDYDAGESREFGYKRLGDRQVVETVHIGDASVRVALGAFGDHLLPTELHFERIFGRDWGPETITLRNLRVK